MSTHTIRLHRVLRAPPERIYRAFIEPDAMVSEMLTAVTLRKVSCGTEVNVVQECVPAVIPAEACCLGWQESLIMLGKLVEAEIPE